MGTSPQAPQAWEGVGPKQAGSTVHACMHVICPVGQRHPDATSGGAQSIMVCMTIGECHAWAQQVSSFPHHDSAKSKLCGSKRCGTCLKAAMRLHHGCLPAQAHPQVCQGALSVRADSCNLQCKLLDVERADARLDTLSGLPCHADNTSPMCCAGSLLVHWWVG